MRLMVLFGLAAAFAFPQAVGADPLLDGIGKLPGAVEDMRVGGTWERDGKNGVYRVVITRSGGDTVVARLFVQWIGHHGSDVSVDDTIEIKELGALKVDVVDYTFDSDQTGLTVHLETIDPNGNADQTYELNVASPTEYKFGPAGAVDTDSGVPKKKS